MYYEYQSLQVENLKFSLDNKFWLSLLLFIYSIIHVKIFASSPRDISKGQYSKIA